MGKNKNLWILIGSDRPVEFDRQQLLTKLNLPPVDFLENKVGIDVAQVRRDVKTATVQTFSQAEDGKPQQVNTDLHPRGEYYLNK